MRVKLITLLSGLLLILGKWQGVYAQSSPPTGQGAVEIAPNSVSPGQGYAQQPPGAEFAPWPETSPYASYQSQHYIDQGLWQNRSEGPGRQFFFGVDYLTGRAKRPKGLLGNPHAMSYIDTIDLANLEADTGNDVDPAELATYFEEREASGLHGLYSPLHLERLGSFDMRGTRMRWGYFNPDDSGFVVTLWFSSEPESVFDAREKLVWPGRGQDRDVLMDIIDTPVDELDDTTEIPRDLAELGDLYTPLDIDQLLQNNLLNLYGLPLDDGTVQELGDGTMVGGVTVPYDLEFKTVYRVETWGGSMDWMGTPRFRSKFFKVRPLGGVRYLQLRERFQWIGRDSGLTYGAVESGNADVKLHSANNHYDDNGDGIVDNAGIVEDDTEGGTTGGGNNNTTASEVETTPFIQFRDPLTSMFPITSFLENDIRSHLVGPEIGLQYELGGVRFKLTGHTKLALVANHEKVWMNGDNIAMITRDADLLPASDTDPRPNRFSEKQSHTHVSPMLEQTICAEAPIFGSLPYLRRIRLLKDTTFRVGYTFIMVGAVARPTESIRWQGNPSAVTPLYPRIDIDRSTWSAGYWNLGIDWRY